jgi:hypothetical protein
VKVDITGAELREHLVYALFPLIVVFWKTEPPLVNNLLIDCGILGCKAGTLVGRPLADDAIVLESTARILLLFLEIVFAWTRR